MTKILYLCYTRAVKFLAYSLNCGTIVFVFLLVQQNNQPMLPTSDKASIHLPFTKSMHCHCLSFLELPTEFACTSLLVSTAFFSFLTKSFSYVFVQYFFSVFTDLYYWFVWTRSNPKPILSNWLCDQTMNMSPVKRILWLSFISEDVKRTVPEVSSFEVNRKFACQTNAFLTLCQSLSGCWWTNTIT